MKSKRILSIILSLALFIGVIGSSALTTVFSANKLSSFAEPHALGTPALAGTKSAELLKNPDRGFRHELNFHPTGGWYNMTAECDIDKYIRLYEEDSPQVAQVYIYLTAWRNRDIDDEGLDNIKMVFRAIHDRNLRMVLRFAYQGWDYDVCSVEQALTHMQQLKPIAEEFKNDIYVMQAGFHGRWGEWHSSDMWEKNLGYTPDAATQAVDRKRLLEGIVDMVPDGLFVQVRTVAIKNLLDENDPRRAKVAYHDDYLLDRYLKGYSTAYAGTEEEQQLREAPYLISDTEMPWGNDAEFRPTPLDPYGVAKNIRKFHYATLSLRHNYKEEDKSYDMQGWKSVAATAEQLSAAGLPCSSTWLKDEQGNAVSRSMFEYIRDYTGYYIEASNASAKLENGKMNVSVSLKNYGTAAPLTMNAPQAVFVDDEGNVLSSAPLCDVADLQPGQTVAANASLDLPEDMSNISLGIRFVNPQGTPAKLANDLEVRNGVNILYDFPITEGRYGAYVVRQMTKNAMDAGDIVGSGDSVGTTELSVNTDGDLRAEFAKNGSTERTSHQITLNAQTKQIADKQYLYFKVKSLSDRTMFLRIQANDGAHGIWSRADKFEFLSAEAEQWTALGVESYGEYEKYVQLPAGCDGWMRVALSDMHNVNGNGKTAADIVSLENLMLHILNWGGDSQTLLLNTVYAADANVDISLLANPGAVILRDMGASEADWENANDLTLTLSNGRLNVNVPQNGGERNAEFILPMTNTDTLGKKYVYFSIDKPSTQEDAQKIWLNVFQAVNEKDWWAEVHDKLEVNDGSGWVTGNFIGNTVGGRLWFRWRIGDGAAAHFFAKNQITKLQFKFASYTAADFSIGNIYAANGDADIPELSAKALLIADMTNDSQMQANETSGPSYSDKGMTAVVCNNAHGQGYAAVHKYTAAKNISGRKSIYYHFTKESGKKTDVAVQLYGDDIYAGWTNYIPSQVDVRLNDSEWSTVEGNKVTMSEDVTDVWIRADLSKFGDADLKTVSKVRFYFDNTGCAQWDGPRVTIGNVYAADADADVPKLPLVVADMTDAAKNQTNQFESTTQYIQNGMTFEINSGWKAIHQYVSVKDVSSKTYLYYHFSKDAGKELNIRIPIYGDDPWGGWTVYDPAAVSVKLDGAAYWKTVNHGEDKAQHFLLTLPADSTDAWVRIETARYAGCDMTKLNKVRFYFDMDANNAKVTIGNVYAANADDEVPGLIPENQAIVVRDMTTTNGIDTANTTGIAYEATENGMKMTINGSNPHMLLSTTNKDVSGKKYYYFHVDKAAAEGNNRLWMLMYAVGNWAGPVNGWQAKFDGRDYWQDVSVDGSHMLLWDNWNGGIWFKHEIYGGSSINQLQFNFRNDHQPTFTIGNIYAANADDEVPGLLHKKSGYTATFVNGDKAVAALQGMTVTAPDAVAIDGFEFVGWADADDYSKIYKAGSKIKLTEDTTFVAAGVSLETLNSASIRWSADDAKRGLRFTGVVRSNLGGAKETGELVSPALVKTAIKDLGNDTVKEVLNSSPKGGNSRWAEESTVTDLCWHGSVTEFAGKGDEVLEHKFSAWAVAEIKYQDGSSGWFVSEATDGFSMKEIAQQIYEQNPYVNGTSVKNVLKEVYHVG